MLNPLSLRLWLRKHSTLNIHHHRFVNWLHLTNFTFNSIWTFTIGAGYCCCQRWVLLYKILLDIHSDNRCRLPKNTKNKKWRKKTRWIIQIVYIYSEFVLLNVCAMQMYKCTIAHWKSFIVNYAQRSNSRVYCVHDWMVIEM